MEAEAGGWPQLPWPAQTPGFAAKSAAAQIRAPYRVATTGPEAVGSTPEYQAPMIAPSSSLKSALVSPCTKLSKAAPCPDSTSARRRPPANRPSSAVAGKPVSRAERSRKPAKPSASAATGGQAASAATPPQNAVKERRLSSVVGERNPKIPEGRLVVASLGVSGVVRKPCVRCQPGAQPMVGIGASCGFSPRALLKPQRRTGPGPPSAALVGSRN